MDLDKFGGPERLWGAETLSEPSYRPDCGVHTLLITNNPGHFSMIRCLAYAFKAIFKSRGACLSRIAAQAAAVRLFASSEPGRGKANRRISGSSDIIPDMNSERLIWLSPIKGVRLVFPGTDEKKRYQALVSQFCRDRS